MSIEDRTKAAAKNIEGKGQQVVGAVTGNSQDELAGKAKHAAEQARDGLADAKDSIVDKAKQLGQKVHDGMEHAKEELNK
jgi:uncharacterized protein YjbJ (UPF0337 family)